MTRSSRIPGFYRLAAADRRRALADRTGLGARDLAILGAGGLDLDTADGMIENAIGTFSLPLAVGLNFVVNGEDFIVPMAIEEPSVVAAASNAAKMVRQGGGFVAEVSPPVMIGQIQVVDVPDPEAAKARIEASATDLVAEARAKMPRLCARGGGPVGITARVLAAADSPDGGMLVAHLHIDCRDAMGANLVNTVAEAMAERIATLAGGRPGLKILSNLADRRTVRVMARVSDEALGGAEVRCAIAAASRFAELDPYRAATHNKGIMNGVDAVVIATGNDWRSVEAGAHAYAARSGRYAPLATWTDDGTALVGRLEMPLAVGTVGGALHVHPAARVALALVAVDSAQKLAQVAAAVGLASNLAALRALATAGIQRGHMSLHARVLARAAGARGDLIYRVAAELCAAGDIHPERAQEIVARLYAEPAARALTLEEAS
ncbi:MAG TPA: hydroxymethylglutaryl-CoA reductase, degradative [Kofleriaceae bacterium]|nr:hydroxymethylglutaryl-CoA reductase, degradative [Kofleriaceae bacterium]